MPSTVRLVGYLTEGVRGLSPWHTSCTSWAAESVVVYIHSTKVLTMSSISPFVIFVSLCVTVTACAKDSETGVEGKVTFSQLLEFPETDGFNSPVAAGSTLLIGLEEPQGFLGSDEKTALAELRLEASGPVVPTVLQVGFAQFAIHFPVAGNYDMNATLDGSVIDTIPVFVDDIATIRLPSHADLITQGDSADCFSRTTAELSGLVLHSNQSATLNFITENLDGAAMSGVVPLVPSVTNGAVKFESSPVLVGNPRGNALSFSPSFSLLERSAKDAQMSVVLAETDFSIATEIRTSPENVPLDCN